MPAAQERLENDLFDSEPEYSSVPPGQELTLPPVEYTEEFRIGRRFCLIEPTRRLPILGTEAVSISPRRTANALHLEGGDTVVVVDKKLDKVPSGVTGVLLREQGGRERWQYHQRLEAFRQMLRTDPEAARQAVDDSWVGNFRYRTEVTDGDGQVLDGRVGLRPPQIGALHAIGAHWSVFADEIATVVMPTGTGKTETMLCAIVAYGGGPTLVMVPSNPLRWQTARKFRELGLLRKLELVPPNVRNPIVAVVTREPATEEDLAIFEGCNVAIGVMASMTAVSATGLLPKIASRFRSLFVDEAHHIPSDSWSAFCDQFREGEHRIVQFTATPFRNDGRIVNGKVIFNYPLAAAQRDHYFKPIRFVSVFEFDQADADVAIAEAALEALREDLSSGLNHLLMARCRRVERGEELLTLYRQLAPDLAPILVHSEMSEPELLRKLDELRAARSRIVVCVNMLGEGFDLPQLKIAALHDLHKSLPILLQFTGRFTRTSASDIGDATVVANIADPKVSAKLERLYSESADWNELLRDNSSEAAQAHVELIEFLRESRSYIEDDDFDTLKIAKSLLHPKFSTVVYRCARFSPETFKDGLAPAVSVQAAWYNQAAKTLYFVTREEARVPWTKAKELLDRRWNLFVLWHDDEAGLLHVNSSDKASLHEKIAIAVGATDRLDGENVFRSLGRINRLIFNNIGVRKHGRRNMSFAMYTGSEVEAALTATETRGASKSNLDGRGWENGQLIAHGCSAKGRIWTKSQGSIPKFIQWARPVGRKVIDPTIDTQKIIQNVLIPTEVTDAFPTEPILSVEWPVETLKIQDDRVCIVRRDEAIPLAVCDLSVDAATSTPTRLTFHVKSVSGDLSETITMELDSETGYRFTCSDLTLQFRYGQRDIPLIEYLQSYPLLVRYVSLNELEGNLLFKPHDQSDIKIDMGDLVTWDWAGVDITVESTWKNGEERTNSIQTRAAAEYSAQGYPIVFNDDDAGEAADLICLHEEPSRIKVVLAHCKYSSKPDPGERVKDVAEVASQAVRSTVWRGNFERLFRHMLARQKVLGSGAAGRSRFVRGDLALLERTARGAKQKPVDVEIVVIQPGVRKSALTPDQHRVLSAASTFIRQTIDVKMKVICSP